MAKAHILVIDDDVDLCTLLDRYLTSKGYQVDTAFTAASGLKLLKERKHKVVLSDFRLPDSDGLALIRQIKQTHLDAQVIVITGYSDVKLAIQSIKTGAFEYVTKPIQPEEILNTIADALKKSDEVQPAPSEAPANTHRAQEPGPAAAAESHGSTGNKAFVTGTSTLATTVQKNIELVAPTDMSVIILGETGTGKEVAARTIHALSKRAGNPFVAIDCGALPENLASSELFGHVKGSFTGALKDKKGSFELANGGTLFLDEIGNLSYENQVRLLRVIQEREVKPVGADKSVPVDVRIIVATNEDLLAGEDESGFREDLYYRLNEFQVKLPALRERPSDIPLFAAHFLKEANASLGKDISGFHPDVEQRFKAYYWHGNLRELRNVVRRAALLTQGDRVELTTLPQDILHPVYLEQFTPPEPDASAPTDLKSVAEIAERKAIEDVLRKTNFNKTKAAEILGIDRKTLYNKITAYDIDA